MEKNDSQLSIVDKKRLEPVPLLCFGERTKPYEETYQQLVL